MTKKYQLNNESGMSLVQVMVVGAMMVGMAVVGMRLTENQNKANRGAQQSSEATSFFSLVSSILSGRNACTNTFRTITTAPNAIPAAGVETPLEFNVPIKDGSNNLTDPADDPVNPVNGRGNRLFIPGNQYGALTYLGMDIYNDGFVFADPPADGNDSGLLRVQLKFRRERVANNQNRTSVGTEEIRRTFHIFVNLEPDNSTPTFLDCYDIAEGITDVVTANVCNQLGGIYDVNTSTCPLNKIYENPIVQRHICEDVMDFNWVEDPGYCNKYVRGAHYGGCSKELLVDTTFKGTYNQIWPVLDCSTNPPTCDVGFRAIQLSGGLVNVTPFGELRAEMSTIWETWACSKE